MRHNQIKYVNSLQDKHLELKKDLPCTLKTPVRSDSGKAEMETKMTILAGQTIIIQGYNIKYLVLILLPGIVFQKDSEVTIECDFYHFENAVK